MNLNTLLRHRITTAFLPKNYTTHLNNGMIFIFATLPFIGHLHLSSIITFGLYALTGIVVAIIGPRNYDIDNNKTQITTFAIGIIIQFIAYFASNIWMDLYHWAYGFVSLILGIAMFGWLYWIEHQNYNSK